ncbi:hypothetical protein ACFTXM_26180 [Streptomyces sp. NPDC056930]
MMFPDGSQVAEFMLYIQDDGTAAWRWLSCFWDEEPPGSISSWTPMDT